MKSTTIYFDLDGTLFDLYGQEDWLKRLRAEDATVFEGNFLPTINRNDLFTVIYKLRLKGVKFGVITWLPMQATPEFEEEAAEVKKKWVYENLPFIQDVVCISYGIPKQNAIVKKSKNMFLIDDNKEVCEIWDNGKDRKAYQVKENNSAVDILNMINLNLI